jgi:hypothetical protein
MILQILEILLRDVQLVKKFGLEFKDVKDQHIAEIDLIILINKMWFYLDLFSDMNSKKWAKN